MPLPEDRKWLKDLSLGDRVFVSYEGEWHEKVIIGRLASGS